MSTAGLLRSERGIALPAALAVLFMVAGLATVTAKAAITSDHQSLRDRNVKQALQAANAGLEAAMYRTNLMQPGSVQCAYKNPATGALTVSSLQGDGWCAEQSEDLGNGTTYTMRISGAQALHANGQALSRRTIIATGAANGVRRRLRLQTNAATGEPVFPIGYATVSLDGLTLPNSVRVIGGVGSNGSILLKNSAYVCGDATPGPGKTVSITNTASMCPAGSTTPAVESFNLQPVDQGTAATDNDNYRIGNPPATDSPDPCTDCNGITWDPATRILRLRNNSTLTLGGGVYSFCGIEIENTAQLKIPVRPLGTGIRIYVDSPEHCGGAGTGSVTVRNTGTILNLNTDPTTFQLNVLGSPTIATQVAFDGVDFSGDLVMAVFAPYSTIRVKGNAHLAGALAAKSIDLQNTAQITYHERIGDITTGSPLRLYKPEHYLECTAVAAAGAAPDSGC
jgi:type II secretory pathway pseudopilin PulG